MRRRRDRTIFDRIVEHYVTSRDFNGLYMSKPTWTRRDRCAVGRLVREGMVQVVSEADYLNPHIRPWASKRSISDQLADIDAVQTGMALCLYPTRRGMEERPELALWPIEPYRQRLAAGGGTLELGYFTVDVIEQYRTTPATTTGRATSRCTSASPTRRTWTSTRMRGTRSPGCGSASHTTSRRSVPTE